ncbi:putative glycosyltransferase EpsH [Novipirellula galeiformis]|uniref:Putative glycosyltransferase EpsH n=1 Tax=Novipirellula galeiformis TaxID=2528004 RepID=A0A5C6CL29_9BACT|nr:glycosyltransferase [Novipirellula galeiformis]TWU24011.1 putative glycosyltransferase EpsH [Novipirellula galeiformis]
MSTAPDVSIILCTYNRADMLRECVESLLNQRTDGEFTFEVVVVDNRSSDNTAELISEMQKTSPVTLRYVFESTPGQVHARHRGFDEAQGEWFANFDDDEVAEPEWVLAMLRLAREKNIRSVGGLLWLRLPPDCDRQLHPRVRRILGESVTWPEPRPYTRRQGPGSGTQLIHRNVLEEVGRYDVSQSLRGYDTDLYRRMWEAGIESWFAPESVAWHVTPPVRLTYKYLHETCFHDGFTFCRRDLNHYGKLRGFGIMLLRVANAGLRHAPQAALAKCLGKHETTLAHWLMLVRAEGYARCYLHVVVPRMFPQRRTLSKYGLL